MNDHREYANHTERQRITMQHHGGCPRCGGRSLYRDAERDLQCWVCGHTVLMVVPPTRDADRKAVLAARGVGRMRPTRYGEF